MALCDQTNVQHRLQIAFTVNPEPVVTTLIAAAQGHIEREYGGPVEAATYVERHTGRGLVILKHHPVTDVTALTIDGTALDVAADITWDSAGIIGPLADGYPSYWSTVKTNAVEVTYDAGFAPGDIPSDIVDVCAWMVVGAFRRGVATGSNETALAAGVSAEEISDYSINMFATSDPGQLVLMTDEQRDVIRYYRTPVLA